jgi:hypothetical protein
MVPLFRAAQVQKKTYTFCIVEILFKHIIINT